MDEEERKIFKDPNRPLRILAFFMWLGLISIILFVILGFIFGYVGWKEN